MTAGSGAGSRDAPSIRDSVASVAAMGIAVGVTEDEGLAREIGFWLAGVGLKVFPCLGEGPPPFM